MMTLMLLFTGVVGGLCPGLLCSAFVWNGSDSAAEPNLIIPKCQEICYNANLYQTLFAGIRQKGVGFMGKDLKDKELGVRENRKCPGNCVVLCVVII